MSSSVFYGQRKVDFLHHKLDRWNLNTVSLKRKSKRRLNVKVPSGFGTEWGSRGATDDDFLSSPVDIMKVRNFAASRQEGKVTALIWIQTGARWNARCRIMGANRRKLICRKGSDQGLSEAQILTELRLKASYIKSSDDEGEKWKLSRFTQLLKSFRQSSPVKFVPRFFNAASKYQMWKRYSCLLVRYCHTSQQTTR